MGYASQEGHIGLRTQAAEGVFDDPGAVAPNNGIFMRHLSGSLGANRELIIPDSEIGGNRDIPQAVMGPVSYSGDLEFYARMESLATLLQAALGSSSTGTSGITKGVDQVGTHTITPIDSALSLPWLSIEEDIAGELETFRYTDARVNTLSLECEPGGYLMGSAGFLARTQLAGATKTVAPVVDTTPLTVGTSMSVTIGGVTTYIVRDFSMEFNNNIEDDTFELGDIDLADLTPKRRELTLSFTIRPDGANAIDLWRQATYGQTAATGPQSGAAFQTSANVNITSFEDVGTGVATPYSLDLDIPNANVEPFRLEPSNDDVLEYDISIQALRPVPGTPLVTATVVNAEDRVH